MASLQEHQGSNSICVMPPPFQHNLRTMGVQLLTIVMPLTGLPVWPMEIFEGLSERIEPAL